MAYGSHSVNKLDFARYLTASIAYLSNQQRDAAGMIVFDDEIRNYVPPSTRQGQFARILHAIEKAAAGNTHRLREAVLPSRRTFCTGAA